MSTGAVGTTKIFENEKTIVWEFVLEPGASTPVHTHEHDYMFYVLDGAPLDVFDANGKPLDQFDAKSGAVFAFTIDGDYLVSVDGKHRVPATHSARNAGPTRYREVLVETK